MVLLFYDFSLKKPDTELCVSKNLGILVHACFCILILPILSLNSEFTLYIHLP